MNNIHSMMFPGLPYGTHEARHDLSSLLYCGASKIPLDKVMAEIANGTLGEALQPRIPLVVAIYDVLTAQVRAGITHTTMKNRIYVLRIFFSWCDQYHPVLELNSVEAAFRQWVEFLLHRVRVEKSIKNMTAYRHAKVIDVLLKSVLGLRLGLLATTRLTANTKKHKAVGSEADKQNLEETFAFGRFLMDVISYLSVEKMVGALPIVIPLRDGRTITNHCGLQDKTPEESCQTTAEKNKFLKRRAPIEPGLVFAKRHSLVNFRIEAEILVFISQTGMNLSQAAMLKKGEFRFQSDGADVLVYRVYKGRRGGEAEFAIFKEYAPLFKSYTEWLGALSDPDDDRLFPFVYPHKIPSKGAAPRFQAVIGRCEILEIKYFRPLALRKTRINWLLRKSRDPDLVAEMAQHTKETLIRVYEEPHHQAAAVEISKFYRMTDPGLTSVGPGMCTAKIHPAQPASTSEDSVQPDCSTPAGCLFCEFQRDVDSEDYVWSLATFQYLKMLELDKYVPPQGKQAEHPVHAVIERIQQKLMHFADSSATRSQWVEEAANRMKEGRFHDHYAGLIHLLEVAL
jgi:integrase